MSVPKVRLFAQAREAAGTAADELPGGTVDEVLTAARQRYGAVFATILEQCRVWVNGEPAEPARRVDDDDEVAVLPPVSGG